jgi:hypothetical protein
MQARMKLIAVALAGALAAGSALAHGGMGYGGMGPGRHAGPQPEVVAQRLGTLKESLKLQPNQTAAWSAFEAKITANMQSRAKLREAMPAPADRDAMADFRVTMMKFNAQAAEEANVARKALVATLSPEQKATFDSFRPGPMAGAGAGNGPGHRHGGGYGPGYGPGGGMRGGCMGGQV